MIELEPTVHSETDAALKLLYLAYWIIILFALVNGLGKATNLTSLSDGIKASKVSHPPP